MTLVLSACSRNPSAGLFHIIPEGLEETPVTVGAVSRMAFATPLGTEHRVAFTVPQGSPTLWLACAAVPKDGRNAAGNSTFSVSLTGAAGDSAVIFKRAIEPGLWEEGTADLTSYAGRTVELTFRSGPQEHPAEGIAYWAPSVVVRSRRGGRPNVLLICIDSLRADHLSCYGYPKPTTTTLDSLAARGCRFAKAIAQAPWTLPSHASLFTSLYPKSHGTGSIRHALSGEALTLAELLRGAGYFTLAIISGGPLRPAYGLNQGFDLYDTACLTESLTDVRNPCTHRRATEWLQRYGEAPFFMFVHYWDVHHDYVPPAPFDTLFDSQYQGDLDGTGVLHYPADMPLRDLEHLVALYDGEIAYTDRYISRLLVELTRLGLSERTSVIITSDHGDEFLEHGSTAHGKSLFQELIQVPLIWVPPGGRGQPHVVNEPVQTVDVAPTILDFLGLGIPEEMEGVSLLPLMRGVDREPRPAFSEARAKGGLKSVVMGNTKLIGYMATQHADAYDLAVDPKEQDPLPLDDIRQPSQLRNALSSFVGPQGKATLEVRVAGTGTRGAFVLTVSGWQPSGLRRVDLEPQDSVEVSSDGSEALLRPECPAGDIDGLSLELPWAEAAIQVDATLHGRPLSPQHVVLGEREHPDRGVPFKIQADDPRLHVPPMAFPPLSTDGPKLYLWIEGGRTPLSVPADPGKETLEELRALGYLW